MKLIVGLGNPGLSYAHSRHNIGFMCVNHFARTRKIGLDKSKGQARIGQGEVAGEKLVIALLQTFMNHSGYAVARLVEIFKVDIADLLVIHDDLDLPVGKIRIRQGGSSGGHKGINSIIARLGNRDFARIRVGIGRPDSDESPDREAEVIDYVLSDFTREEREIMEQTVGKVSEAILCLVTDGLDKAMNKYN